MTDQTSSMPTPQPNDGSLNTELPVDTQAAVPLRQKSSFKKRPIIMGVLGIFTAAGLVYTITSSSENYTARGKNQIPAAYKNMQKTATPTAAITKTVEQEAETVDLGDIDKELKTINDDVNSL